MGHIIPLRAICNAFKHKYGEEFEIIESNFFSESQDKDLLKYHHLLCNEVKKHNTMHWYGHGTTFFMDLMGTKFSSWYAMKVHGGRTYKKAIDKIDEVNPDVVVSSHFASNYYATKTKCQPLTVVYSPDVKVSKMFEYKADLVLTSYENGYELAMKNKKRFNEENLKLVPIALREELIEEKTTKEEARKLLSIDERFTICITEGGYGIGKIEKVINECIKRNLPVNIIAITGKNEKLYERLVRLEDDSQVSLFPVPFQSNISKFLIASDLFLGKAGANTIAEAVFFGLPSIITSLATDIEKNNAHYYMNIVQCSLLITKTGKIVDQIEHFLENKNELEELHTKALSIHECFNVERIADEIYKFIRARGK